MKIIEIYYLKRRFEVFIDDEDYDYISQHQWYLNNGRYARTYLKSGDVLMTRMIMSRYFDIEGKDVDHKNHNTFDNRKENLRAATEKQNMWNAVKKNINSTGFKGVSKSGRKFSASIRINDKDTYLGLFETARLAGIAYDLKAKECYGEFALLNVLDAEKEEIDEVINSIKNPKKHKGSSRFRGVTMRMNGKFMAQINPSNQTINLGTFENEIDAAMAYNEAAIKYFGDKAKLNQIENW